MNSFSSVIKVAILSAIFSPWDLSAQATAVTAVAATVPEDEIEIVGGVLVAKAPGAKKPDKPAPDAGQVLEFTDGSKFHGRLVTLGKNELVLQRDDLREPLTFPIKDVRRIHFGDAPAAADLKANATLKLRGGDWIAGELSALEDGRFRLGLGGDATVEVERSNVAWLFLSPTTPVDAYEGPTGTMGAAGWNTGGAWQYRDGALISRNPAPLSRKFDFLPDSLDMEFTVGDEGMPQRSLSLWLDSVEGGMGYTKGTANLNFQGNTVSANCFDGRQMKNLSAKFEDIKNAPKLTRYRILRNRSSGKLIVFVNGVKIADWTLPGTKDPAARRTMIWQPTSWSSNSTWTLAKVRLTPWDGNAEPDPKADEAARDLLSKGTPGREAGAFEGLTKESVQFSGKEIARKEPLFIRLAAGNAVPPPAVAVARVSLSQRGEFDVAEISIGDGRLKLRTSFSGEIALPVAVIRSVEFPHVAAAPDKAVAGDSLIFRNGDSLRGTLVSAGPDQVVKWKGLNSDKPMEFGVEPIAGIVLARKADPPAAGGNAGVRLRNGDWVSGDFQLLDKEHVLLKTPLAEKLQIARAAIRTLYFGRGGELPAWDGATDPERWMRCELANAFGQQAPDRKDGQPKQNPWRYMDGAFTLAGAANSSGGYRTFLGRSFDTMPEKVEVTFEMESPKGSPGYAIQLFTGESSMGLMIQGSWVNAFIYDVTPRKQGAGFFNQQQVRFGGRLNFDPKPRVFRFLADRKTGQLAMIVDGNLVAQYKRRGEDGFAFPGKGIAVGPTSQNGPLTISKLWVGPWSGALPEAKKKFPAEEKPGAAAANGVKPVAPDEKEPAKPEEELTPPEAAPSPLDTVVLANGDETPGTVESATPDELLLKCEAGDIEIPLNRAIMVGFAGDSAPPGPGIRLHLAGKGALTVKSFRLVDGQVSCQSVAAGDLTFPVSLLSEIVLRPRR